MAKDVADAALDLALAYVTASDVQHLCSAQPANYAGIAAVSLGSVTPTYTGPANGDVSGRKITVAQKLAIPITATGNVTHVVLAKVSDSTLRYIATCSSQAVTSGGTADCAAFKYEINEPS